MNLLDATVTKILSKPYKKHVFWCVDVEIDVYGSRSETTAYFKTEEDAIKCNIGYTYKC